MSTYVSCNCAECKYAPARIKGEHKRKAHRALRRLTRLAIRVGDYTAIPARVSSGYRS